MSRWTYTFKTHSLDNQQGNIIERDLSKEFDRVMGDFIKQDKRHQLAVNNAQYKIYNIRHDMSYACERTQPS